MRKPSRELNKTTSEFQRGDGKNRLSKRPGESVSDKSNTGAKSQPAGLGAPEQDDLTALLTDEDVKSFQKLYKARFGADIGYDDAYELGLKLVRLMEMVYQPMTLDEHDRLQNRRRES